MIDDAMSVATAFERLGVDLSAASSQSVAGGCISSGRRVQVPDGRSFFVKRSTRLPADMFPAEATGLAAMHSLDAIRVPKPYAVNAPEAQERFIVMEWIPSGSSTNASAVELGRSLAHMHRTGRGRAFGFSIDNYIGSTRQPNEEDTSWLAFFSEKRLGFQTRLALDSGKLDASIASQIEEIQRRLSALLPDTDHPALLHGDLWAGNYMIDDRGNPVLIDPATYYGHREADLAMTRLFGGFPSAFYNAYEEEWPLEPGFDERADLYNLYHMLNHLNIFGSGYLGSVRSIVNRFR